MKSFKRTLPFYIVLGFTIFSPLFIFHRGISQTCSSIILRHRSDIPSTCNQMAMTMKHDVLDRPYLYVANKVAGLKIYNLSNPVSPVLVASVSTKLYDSLDVMNLTQNGNYLYLALGNHFTNPQPGGLAIVDVSNPIEPVVTDFYKLPGSNSGAGAVKVQQDIAYLGAMQSGLVLLDIQDKNNIQFVSQLIPDINFPLAKPNANLYNARGLEVKGDLVYLCYDAGGLRLINCKNKFKPFESGRYANPALHQPFNLPRAYNNLVLHEPYVYVAVDYCGMEVLNISDTGNIKLSGWWNPYNCPANNWFTSPVHANEITHDTLNQLLFLSTGRSDAVVLDIVDPASPLLCKQYGENADGFATWGISSYKNEVYLSYICALGIPFFSNWTGIKLLTYTPRVTPIHEYPANSSIIVFPNPAKNQVTIKWTGNLKKESKLILFNLLGQKIHDQNYLGTENEINIDTSTFLPGAYFIHLILNEDTLYSRKILISK